MTSRGLQCLLKERDYLVKDERPKVTETVAWAASLGDRSENADYQYGKKRLREIDSRLRFLNSRINTAHEIDPFSLSTDKVQIGLVVEFLENEQIESIELVGVDEVDLKKRRFSWRSPLGKSLLGKEIGDEVEFSAPNGARELEIIGIHYPEKENL